MKPLIVHSLQDLKPVKKALAERRAEAKRLAAEQVRAQRRARAEASLFARAVGPVQPLRTAERVLHTQPAPSPLPYQRQLDEQQVLRESLSDEFDVSTLLQTDEHLSFCRPGIGPDVPVNLRRGYWAVQAQLDLHGMRSDEAREALGQFLRRASKSGLRCVRIIHGKGLGSPGRVPILKNKVLRWLVQKREVLAFVQARPVDGGAGALMVLLASPGR